MKNYILLISILFSVSLFSQNEDRVWYFGANGVGIDFRDCRPEVITNSESGTFEGSVSICDATTGDLLFYSTGTKIVDSTFNTMPNGLNIGNGNSGTQNTIVRKPGSNTVFYYFTTDIQGGNIVGPDPAANGLSYAIIDMTLNGGLGDVVSHHNPIKDISNCEKLTAIRHANGIDVWLIAHEFNNNHFFVYLIDESGVNLTPSVYSVGPDIIAYQSTVYADSNFDAIGELKASPDGSKIAFTTLYNGITSLFDFDNLTGAITNAVELDLEGFGGYGMSFSPDNQKLYIGCVDTTDFSESINSQLVQFDLSSGIPEVIQDSKEIINSCLTCSYRSLKLAPNGKIYCAKSPTLIESESLAVINEPNNLGALCEYEHEGLYLEGRYGSWGLNNIMETNNFCTENENQGFNEEFQKTLVELSYDNYTSSLFFDCSVQHAEVKLFDINGRVVKQMNLDEGSSSLKLESLQNGVYIAFVFIEGQPTLSKLKFAKY